MPWARTLPDVLAWRIGRVVIMSVSLQENGILAIFGSDLGSELTTTCLRKIPGRTALGPVSVKILFALHQTLASNSHCTLK